ncbi:cytochrome P450 4C1-like [Tetranychus urticae]|uniref:Cytochrome P450 n=1 Tax=Tetranychus urticae TaxID=32264 RepID=M1GUP1_TETUR|nr:cytochrome P450 4C1-like [Tetranychus urticae]AGE34480.1 cytochrome P450 [Tetranychus urticae]
MSTLDIQPELDPIETAKLASPASSSLPFHVLILRIILSVLVCFLGYYYLYKKAQAMRRRNQMVDKLPGPKSFNPLMGNLPIEILKYIGADYEASKDLYYIKDEPAKLSKPNKQAVKPDALFTKTILSNNFLLDKSSQYDLLHPWLGTGLLTSTGNKWRSRRKLLVPAFHFKILHDFVPVFNEQGSIMVSRLREIARSGEAIDIVPVVTACTLDIICETIMGVSIGAQNNPNNSYCRAVYEVGECFLERLMQPSYWPDAIYYRLERGKEFRRKVQHLHDFTMGVIRDRKDEMMNKQGRRQSTISLSTGSGEPISLSMPASGERRLAFMDLLLKHHINGGELSEEDIREEVDTFMFEGHDTTAMAMSWIIYLLGHNMEVQDRLALEVDSLFDDLHSEMRNESNSSSTTEITLDAIKQLKYLDCVVKEGLRLCPSVPLIGRSATEGMTISGHVVPAGTVIYCFIYQLHRDPEIFPDPEVFNPDRFLPENSGGRHPFAFVPFSAGPRNCIGQKFALAELKIVLARLIRHYRFVSLDQPDKVLFTMEMVLRPKVPIKVKVYERVFNRTPYGSLNMVQ